MFTKKANLIKMIIVQEYGHMASPSSFSVWIYSFAIAIITFFVLFVFVCFFFKKIWAIEVCVWKVGKAFLDSSSSWKVWCHEMRCTLGGEYFDIDGFSVKTFRIQLS